MSFFSVKNLSVDLKEFHLHDVSLQLVKGDYCTIIGPTGAGKTILLETIVGFHELKSGTIYLEDRDITEVAPEKRKIGIVYQDYALMPHFTIYKNIEYGLKKTYSRKKDSAIIEKKIKEIAHSLNISHLLKRKPGTLSGGEQQRASLARALIVEPKLLLMDEPLSALDPLTRNETRKLLKALIKKTNMTVLHITHDLDDVWSFASKVSVFREGEQLQFGTVKEVFTTPVNEFVASFVGASMYTGHVDRKCSECNARSCIDLNGICIKSTDDPGFCHSVNIAIRPENIIISKECDSYSPDFMNVIESKLIDILFEGNVYIGIIEAGSVNFRSIIPHWRAEQLKTNIGSQVFTIIPHDHVKILKKNKSA